MVPAVVLVIDAHPFWIVLAGAAEWGGIYPVLMSIVDLSSSMSLSSLFLRYELSRGHRTPSSFRCSREGEMRCRYTVGIFSRGRMGDKFPLRRN